MAELFAQTISLLAFRLQLIAAESLWEEHAKIGDSLVIEQITTD